MPDLQTAPALPKPRGHFFTPRRLDAIERMLVVVVYLGLVGRIVLATLSGGGLANLLLLPSEGLVVVFLLFRHAPQRISQRPSDWVLAMGATLGPMLVAPGEGRSLVPAVAGATVFLAGMLIQLHAKIVLARSFGCVPACRGLKTGGPYRFVRHPMYAGYLLGHVAFFAMNPTAWNLGVYAVCYLLQVSRLLAEERFLNFDLAYQHYCQRVRYRLIPGLF